MARAPGRWVVLDDRERELFREIQRRLRDDDPDFARTLHTGARHLPRPVARDLSRRTYTFLIALCSTSGVLLLLAGHPVIALLFGALAGWSWYARTHPYEDDR